MGIVYGYIWSVVRYSPALLAFSLLSPVIIWGIALRDGGVEATSEGAAAFLYSLKMSLPAAVLSAVATVLVYRQPAVWKTNIAFVLYLVAAMLASLGFYVPFHELFDVRPVQTGTLFLSPKLLVVLAA